MRSESEEKASFHGGGGGGPAGARGGTSFSGGSAGGTGWGGEVGGKGGGRGMPAGDSACIGESVGTVIEVEGVGVCGDRPRVGGIAGAESETAGGLAGLRDR
jgi:hypothetical protein